MSLPNFAARYFWGDNLEELDHQKHAKYIVQTILERGDVEALRWLSATYTLPTIKALLPKLKLSEKSANFWRRYLA